MKLDFQKSDPFSSSFHDVFTSADPSALFDLASLSLMWEIRAAVRPQGPAHSSTKHTWGLSINFNLHPIFNNQGRHLVSQFYPCWLLVLCSLPSPTIYFPSSFQLSCPHFHPILQLHLCGGRQWGGSKNSPQAQSSGQHRHTLLLLFCTVRASQEHSFHLSAAEPLPVLGLNTSIPSSGSSSGVSPEPSSVSKNSGLMCSLYRSHSSRFWEAAKHFCCKLPKLQQSSQYRYQAWKFQLSNAAAVNRHAKQTAILVYEHCCSPLRH